MEKRMYDFEKWHNEYCTAHPEYNGYDDNAIDAFWRATKDAGFSADDVHNGLTAMEKVVAVKAIHLSKVIDYIEQINSDIDWSDTEIFEVIKYLKIKVIKEDK
jgi:hypothetical protein